MAILKDPWSAGGARGSIGGVTFSNWKGVNFIRTRRKPVRRIRSSQAQNRSLLGYLSRSYGDLSDAFRLLWENYALNHPELNAFGQEFIMSGINAYVKLNHSAMRLFGAGARQDQPPVEDPPATINTMAAVTGAINPGDIDVSWTEAGTPAATDKVEIRLAGPFISPARQEVFERKRWVVSVDGDVLLATLQGLVEAQWYHVYVRYVTQRGQTTAWHTAKATPKLTP